MILTLALIALAARLAFYLADTATPSDLQRDPTDTLERF